MLKSIDDFFEELRVPKSARGPLTVASLWLTGVTAGRAQKALEVVTLDPTEASSYIGLLVDAALKLPGVDGKGYNRDMIIGNLVAEYSQSSPAFPQKLGKIESSLSGNSDAMIQEAIRKLKLSSKQVRENALLRAKQEREAKLAQETKMKEQAEMLGTINRSFLKKENWSFPGKERLGDVRDGKDGLMVTFTSGNDKIKRADLGYESRIIEGDYKIDLTYNGEGVVGFWSYDGAGRPILIDEKDRVFLANGPNTITLPGGVKKIKFFLATTPDARNIAVTSFKIAAK